MSVKVMSMVWEYSQAKGGDLLILLAIADHADDDGRAFPGEERLAKKGRMSDRNVRNCLQGLQAMGELSVIIGGGRGRSNHYQIHLDVLLSRAKEGNVFQEKISRKLLPGKNNLEKSDIKPAKPGSGLPPNHQLTTTIINTEETICVPIANQPILETPSPIPPKKKGRHATPKHPFPDGYTPSATLTQELQEKFPGADVPRLAEKMRNWAMSNGEWKSDWNATLRTFAQSDWERRGAPKPSSAKTYQPGDLLPGGNRKGAV